MIKESDDIIIKALGKILQRLKYSGAIQSQPLSSGADHQGFPELAVSSSSLGEAAAFSASYSAKLSVT